MEEKQNSVNSGIDESKQCEDEKSIKVMYNELVRLYNLEMDSHDTLKDKTNSIIVFNGAIITLVTLSFVQLIVNKINTNFNLYLLVIPYICLFISLFFAIWAYKVKELAVVDAKNLFVEFYCTTDIKLLDQLCANIADDVNDNKEISEERSKLVNYALFTLSIGLLFFVVMFLVFILT